MRHKTVKPIGCKACNKLVAKGKWGQHCRSCKDFVCSAACKRTLTEYQGCRCTPSSGLPISDVNPAAQNSVELPTQTSSSPSLSTVPPDATFEELLAKSVQFPAPPLLQRVPAVLEVRYGCLLRDALMSHADAEHFSATHPSYDASQRPIVASRFLWALTPALLHYPPGHDQKQAVNMAHTSFHISKVIRQRLQLAESGNWIQLLRQCLEASRVNQTSVQRKFLEHSLSEPPSAERLREKAVNKAKQGNLHAARNILCGQIAAPLTPATATVVDALVAVEVPRCETSAQEKLFSDIRGMTAKFAPPKMRAIRRRLYSLNLGAESGPSGMRNAHVTCLARAHNGLVALQKWVRMWKAGEVSQDSALLWTSSIVVPIDCGSRQDGSRKLRPIALTEHMLKFTESVIIDECLPQLRGAFEPHQLGAGTADGNVLIYRILQTWLNDIESHGQVEPHAPVVEERNPSNDVLLGLDMENAYGRFFRSAALKATVARVPELAHLVLAEWGPGRTMYWQRIDGEWKISPTMRGGWQGSRLAMIMFCMSLEHSMDAMPQPVKDHVARVGYQDDTYFVGNMYTLASEWDGVNEAFASGGHRLNGTKSSVFLPCWNDVPTAGMPQILQQWLAQICRSSNGLATMGCAAQGTFESALGPYQFALESARKRLDRASIFKDKLTELVATDTDDSTLHVAWLLTTKSLNQTLTYDARLLRPEVLAGVTGQRGSMVRTAVEHIMGRSLTGDAWEQLQLPGPLGGMGLRLPTVSSHAAYLSTWISCRDKVNLLCAALGRVAMNTVGEVDALASQAHLRAAGVEVR